MQKGFFVPLMLGMAAGAALGMAAANMSDDMEMRKLCRQAGKTVKDMLDK